MRRPLWIALLAAVVAGLAAADEADVVAARAVCNAEGSCRFSVSVRHADTGWEHYADRWEVLGPGGEVLATRVLQHPHVKQQPFTRFLDGVELPEGVAAVQVRARDSVHGYGGREATVSIEPPAPGAEVPAQ